MAAQPVQHPQNVHQTPQDVRAQMAAAFAGGTADNVIPFPQPAPAPQSAPPVAPQGFQPPAPRGPSTPAFTQEQINQALADQVPTFTLPGTPAPVMPVGDEGADTHLDTSGEGDQSPTSAPTLSPERAAEIDAWVSGRSPRELMILDGMMNGTIEEPLAYTLITGKPLPSSDPAPRQPAPEPQPQFDPNAFADPDLAAYVQGQLGQITAQQQQILQAQQANQQNLQLQLQREHHAAITLAGSRLQERLGIDADAVERAALAADQLGIISNLLGSGSTLPLDQVYERALELGTRLDDSTYQAQLAAATTSAAEAARVANDRNQSERTKTMKANASTVSAIASRDLPKTPQPVDPRTMTDEQRLQAAASLIAAYRNQ